MDALEVTISPIYFLAAWALIGLVLQTMYLAVSDAIATSKILHQIPCARCQFFTNSYYLKCTVNPTCALTETAINCRDFYQKQK